MPRTAPVALIAEPPPSPRPCKYSCGACLSAAGHQLRPMKSAASDDLDEIGTAHLGWRFLGAVIGAGLKQQHGNGRIFGEAGGEHCSSRSSPNDDDVVAVHAWDPGSLRHILPR